MSSDDDIILCYTFNLKINFYMEYIESIGELIEKIENRIKEKNEILWFRGHRCANWGVEPSIVRGTLERGRWFFWGR